MCLKSKICKSHKKKKISPQLATNTCVISSFATNYTIISTNQTEKDCNSHSGLARNTFMRQMLRLMKKMRTLIVIHFYIGETLHCQGQMRTGQLEVSPVEPTDTAWTIVWTKSSLYYRASIHRIALSAALKYLIGKTVALQELMSNKSTSIAGLLSLVWSLGRTMEVIQDRKCFRQ